MPQISNLMPQLQSLGFIRKDYLESSRYVEKEVRRFTQNENGIESEKIQFNGIFSILEKLEYYYSIPTQYLVLEVTTEWSVLIVNDIGCSGYDSLLYNITRLYGVETLHIQSNDEKMTMLPGSLFISRIIKTNEVDERRVQSSVDDSDKWIYYENGNVRPWENPINSKKTKKRDRLNNAIIQEYLSTLSINVYKWHGSGMEINGRIIKRNNFPKSIAVKKYNPITKKFT